MQEEDGGGFFAKVVQPFARLQARAGGHARELSQHQLNTQRSQHRTPRVDARDDHDKAVRIAGNRRAKGDTETERQMASRRYSNPEHTRC